MTGGAVEQTPHRPSREGSAGVHTTCCTGRPHAPSGPALHCSAPARFQLRLPQEMTPLHQSAWVPILKAAASHRLALLLTPFHLDGVDTVAPRGSWTEIHQPRRGECPLPRRPTLGSAHSGDELHLLPGTPPCHQTATPLANASTEWSLPALSAQHSTIQSPFTQLTLGAGIMVNLTPAHF